MILMDESDIAWEAFKKGSQTFSKSSLADKLDTLSAQMNEIQTTSARLASIVPQLMGDSTALDAADSVSELPQEGPVDSPDSNMMPNAESIGPMAVPSGAEGGDMSADTDKKDIEAGAEDHPVDETMPPAKDDTQLPVGEGVEPTPEPEPVQGSASDESAPIDEAPEEGGFAATGYEYNSDSAFQDLVDTIAEEIQESLGKGDFDKAEALMAKIKALREAWSAIPVGDGVPMEPPIDGAVPPEAMGAAVPPMDGVDVPSEGADLPPLPPEAIRKSDGCGTDDVVKADGELDDADVSADADSVTANDSEDDSKEKKECKDEDEDEDDDEDDEEDEDEDDESFVKSDFSASAIFDNLSNAFYGAPAETEAVAKSEPVAEKVLEGFDDFVKSDRPPSFGAVGSNIAYTPSAMPRNSFAKSDVGEELTLENITKKDWEALENHLLYKSQ